jgi:hypothetical protein
MMLELVVDTQLVVTKNTALQVSTEILVARN